MESKELTDEDKDYFVARVYSHTDRQLLWKIVSRPMKHEADAETWARFMESEEPKHKFFVISRPVIT